MRTMAIDYGDQRIGLAVSDLLGMLAGEAWTMQEWDMERAASRIAERTLRGMESFRAQEKSTINTETARWVSPVSSQVSALPARHQGTSLSARR